MVKIKKDIISNRMLGYKFEKIAKKYLEFKGLKYVDKNVYSRYGEIDLIFLDENEEILVFVEVKYRSNIKYGSAIEVISKNKINKIYITVNKYLSEVKWEKSIRLDVVAIDKKDNKYEVNWIKNAF